MASFLGWILSVLDNIYKYLIPLMTLGISIYLQFKMKKIDASLKIKELSLDYYIYCDKQIQEALLVINAANFSDKESSQFIVARKKLSRMLESLEQFGEVNGKDLLSEGSSNWSIESDFIKWKSRVTDSCNNNLLRTSKTLVKTK